MVSEVPEPICVDSSPRVNRPSPGAVQQIRQIHLPGILWAANYFETIPFADALPSMTDPHISQHDLKRYHLGMVVEESELAPLEEHILA